MESWNLLSKEDGGTILKALEDIAFSLTYDMPSHMRRGEGVKFFTLFFARRGDSKLSSTFLLKIK